MCIFSLKLKFAKQIEIKIVPFRLYLKLNIVAVLSPPLLRVFNAGFLLLFIFIKFAEIETLDSHTYVTYNLLLKRKDYYLQITFNNLTVCYINHKLASPTMQMLKIYFKYDDELPLPYLLFGQQIRYLIVHCLHQ